jgi:2-polyprenyl-6-methoxyphenol hydroxylase-like FAD-dependent oxidoreductase
VDAPDAPSATFFSRPFLEAGVRARVEALPNVTFRPGSVQGLTARGPVVNGVSVDVDGTRTTLPATLVVDTSGRSSHVERWLDAVGATAPPVDRVQVDMAYASRMYTRTPGNLPDRSWFVTISDPAESRRFAVAFPIEGDRWIVTLAGCHGDHPPTDDDAHLGFAESLPTKDIAGIIRAEQPLGPVVPYRLASSQWRRFDKLREHPVGFVALGDSICSFNPIYGQGMSSAAQQAMVLGHCIDRVGPASPALPRRFYKQARKVIANPWSIAAGGDFVFPETTGPKPPGTDVVNRYVAKVIVASQRDVRVANALWHVQGLLAPPPSLMKPTLALRVLRAARRGPAPVASASEELVSAHTGSAGA